MTTAARPTTRVPASTEPTFDLARPSNRSRVAPLLTGGLLMLLGSLAFVYLAGGDPSRPVAMMGRDVPRGGVVGPDDLVRADISSDTSIGVVPWEQAQSMLIGKTAASDLLARTLPSAASVTDEPALPSGTRAVGLVLVAGEMPTDQLGIGDRVDVVRVDDDGANVVALGVPIQRIVDDEGQYFVTLVVPEADAVSVAEAASAASVRLTKVPLS